MRITGTHIAYHFICARKLWLFDHNIQCEHESDAVRLGRHIHETAYNRKKKEIDVDGLIVVDWIDHDNKVIHEVKKSGRMEHSHRWQLKYYMWYLEQKGLSVADETTTGQYPEEPEKRGYIGELNYPKLKQTEPVILKQSDREQIEEKILPQIREIVSRPEPPPTVEWKVCKSCSYCELCHS